MENKKYSLLIVALYCHTIHVKAVINHLKTKNPLVDITLLTEKVSEMKKLIDDKSVEIIEYNVSPVNSKYRWIRFLRIKHRQCKFFANFSKNKRFDIVNVHFPNKYMRFVYKYLRAMSKNLVITPWGSDVLKVTDKKAIKELGQLYRMADWIATASNIPLGKRIIEEFKVAPNKLVGNFFGSDIVDYAINKGNAISQEECKKYFGLTGRYVITCGYCMRSNQRHKTIIAAIDHVRDKLPKNLTLLFPMTYTYSNTKREPTYLAECKKECEDRNLPAVFVTDFLSVEDVYKLRKATDMFVHIQPTDANSSSMQEFILCDKKIVHGSWIKYEEYEAFKPLFYFPVDKLEDLGEIIAKAYNSEKINIPQGIIDIIKSNGYESKSTKMNDFFMSIVE